MQFAGWSYVLIMLVALGVCSLLLRLTQRSLPISPWQKMGIGVGAFCGAMLGAKLPFLLSDPQGMWDGTAWLSHGKTILFGIVGGYLGVELAKQLLGVRLKTGDTFAVPVAVAVAIGRWSCFVAGCCYGKPTTLPWGVVFATASEQPHLPRHPTQIYESIFHAVAAAGLYVLLRRGLLRGQLIKLYIISYLVYRFLSEFLRPEQPLVCGLTGYQLAALALLPMFVYLWHRDAGQLATAAASGSDLSSATRVEKQPLV